MKIGGTIWESMVIPGEWRKSIHCPCCKFEETSNLPMFAETILSLLKVVKITLRRVYAKYRCPDCSELLMLSFEMVDYRRLLHVVEKARDDS